MTIDERLEFLLQSTESLHAQGQQLQATLREMGIRTDAKFLETDAKFRETDAKIRETDAKIRETDARIGIIAETIRALGEIAHNHQAHIGDHTERLEKLEGPSVSSA